MFGGRENYGPGKANVNQGKKPFSESRWIWAAVIAVAIFVAFYVLSVLMPFQRFGHHLITNLMYTPLPIAAAIACFYAYRRVRRQDKTVLLFLGLGTLSLALGEVSWAYYEVFLGLDEPP